MAFKMKGPSTHKGTLRHKMELKNHAEQLKLNRSMDGTSVPDGRAGSSPYQFMNPMIESGTYTKKDKTKKNEPGVGVLSREELDKREANKTKKNEPGVGVLKSDQNETPTTTKKETKTKTNVKKETKKPYVKKGGSATRNMKDLKIGSKERYEEYERRGWAHDDTTKGYKPETKTTTTTNETKEDTTPKTTKKDVKVAKLDYKKTKAETKATKKKGEIDENLSVRQAKLDKKKAKITSGKGSKEYLEAKLKQREAKGRDLAGEGGGKRAKLFGNWRRAINRRKQAKLRKKIAEASDE